MPNILALLTLVSVVFIVMLFTRDKVIITATAVIIAVIVFAYSSIYYAVLGVVKADEAYIIELKTEVEEDRKKTLSKIENLTRAPLTAYNIKEINEVIDTVAFYGVTTEYFVILDVITEQFSNTPNEKTIPIAYHIVMDHIDLSAKNEEMIRAYNKKIDDLVNGKYFKYLFIKHPEMKGKPS
jgi:hypothetical protein